MAGALTVASLRHADPALLDQRHRLDLEFSSKPASGFMKHPIPVSTKPAAAHRKTATTKRNFKGNTPVLYSVLGPPSPRTY